ncbi:expressed unknown protein [Ectocarpus siliculosus]|uniref:Uncharacterized protein n=1 Tax=Ectocarpus siliculosus TaxID=2880 RepID=D7FLA0_ECTSI|nr:expressed unknown protein [Ectocarpus siliculosus]|eukprot:CBJ29671.1 expressed unknown protein [Ectocarpus siliculosus]
MQDLRAAQVPGGLEEGDMLVPATHDSLYCPRRRTHERIVDTLSLSERRVSVPAPYLLSSDDVPGKEQGSAGVAFVRLSMPKTMYAFFFADVGGP